MRLRVGDILAERGLTAYWLHKESAGAISLSAAYRLAEPDFREISADRIAALCAVLEVKPGELFEYTPAKRGKGRG